MGLKYIYAGYAKCGTKTMAAACRTLGLKVYDFEEMCLYTLDDWIKFYKDTTSTEERNKILYNMLKDVDVVLDMPFYFIWKELLDVFPECKVIFYERDEDEWFKSYASQARRVTARFYNIPDPLHDLFNFLFRPSFSKILKVRKLFLPLQLGQNPGYIRCWNGRFNNYNEHLIRRCYRQNNADIKVNCPPEKLLKLDNINCGYDILCTFMQLPSADQIWPHKNKQNGRSIIDDLWYENKEAPLRRIAAEDLFKRLRLYFFLMLLIILVVYILPIYLAGSGMAITM